MICHWCKEQLIYDCSRGWVHQDGSIYKQVLENGELKDDHCVLPAPSDCLTGAGE